MTIRFGLLGLAMVLAACSWTTADNETGTGIPPIDAPDGASEILSVPLDAADALSEVASEGNSAEATGTQETDIQETGIQDIDSEPVERVPDNQGLIEESNWLARSAMDSSSVELVWSPVDGATTYRLYRLPTADAVYDSIATGSLAGAEEIYEGLDFGYIDTDVPENTFLTYLIVAELDDGLTQPRWTEALTVDDVTPPSSITDLVAEVTDGGVLLTWAPSTDDVEFAAYNVQVFVDGRLQYLGGGADPGQTSFLDTDPLDGLNQYVVTAVDFHNNRSDAGEVEVDVR